MAASTSEGLRAQILAAKRELEEKTAYTVQLDQELQQANERQSLRRELDRIKKRIALREDINLDKKVERDMIDRDMCGDHLPQGGYHAPGTGKLAHGSDESSGSLAKNDGQVMNCSEIVARGEYVWKIEGLSWLQNTLKQNGLCYASSEPFTVGGETFAFVYNPSAGKVSLTAEEQHGSLAIIHEDDDGITFRYRIFIKRRGGDFLQWGDTGDECHPTTDTCGWAFGPDVQQQDPCRYVPRQTGIFGLTHKQLLDSEWVENDSLTVKFELEVRPDDWYGRAPLKPHVEVPPCTFAQDMKALLDDGRCSDVEFVVQDERMTAHTAILCARSEVFETELTTGMLESKTKEIVIQDCDVVTFKALLHFLYTDSFTCVDELVKSMPAGSGGTEELPNPRLQLLQGLLAASHKYQVKRLRLWCEQQLCESITVAKVCDVLCQAHLYEAKQLEKACLSFIKNHMEDVVITSQFGALSKDWPQVMLKLSIYTAGVSEARATPAMDAFDGNPPGKKRKLAE